MPLVLPGGNSFAGIMDRRGMVVPRDGRFAVEIWCRVGEELIVPAGVLNESAIQYDGGTSVAISFTGGRLHISAEALALDNFQFLKVSASVSGVTTGLPLTIYFAVRPYGLEGVTPVHDLVYNSKGFWMSESRVVVVFPRRPELSWASDARHGDAAQFLMAPPERTAVRCSAGMATAVSAFHFAPEANGERAIEVLLPLEPVYPREVPFAEILPGDSGGRRSTVLPRGTGLGGRASAGVSVDPTESSAKEASQPLAGTGGRRVESKSLAIFGQMALGQVLAAADITAPRISEILLHRNHWIVAAVRALMTESEEAAAVRLLSFCLLGMQRNGYLPQGRGKWAFQGQALTAVADFYRARGGGVDETLARYSQVKSMAKWIMRKRREVSHAPTKPAGLFPPGLSRNGIGQDYHLADNFWGIEGLQAASWLARQFGDHADADAFHADAMKFAGNVKAAIHRELEYGIMQQVPGRLHRAFDASSGAELLDLALTDEARSLLAPVDWFGGLLRSLGEPLGEGVDRGNLAEGAGGVPLISMDERGVYPARRLMLLFARWQVKAGGRDDIDEEVDRIGNNDLEELDRLSAGLTTPLGVWPETIDPGARLGCGRLLFDPEAAALYLFLGRKLNPAANNQAT
jgi:hypothetical protein